GGGAGGAVGDEGVAGARAAGPPEVLVEDEGVVLGQAIDVLAEAPSKSKRGRAHAVGDHEDEVALVGATRGAGGLLVVLGPDGYDDDGGSCDEGPDKDASLAQARPAAPLVDVAAATATAAVAIMLGAV